MCVTAIGSGVPTLRVVDSGSERLDAKPNRCGFQFRETMRMEMVSFSELVLNPVQVVFALMAGVRRLCHRRDVVASPVSALTTC